MQGDREERIRHRAYEIWESAGRPEGEHDAHWAQARAEIGEEDHKAAEGGGVESVLRRTTEAAAEVLGAGLNAVADVVGEALAPKKSRSRKGKAVDAGSPAQQDKPARRRVAAKTSPPAAATGSHAMAKTSDMDDVPEVLKPTRGKIAQAPENEAAKGSGKGAGADRGKSATGQSGDAIH